MLIQEKGTVVVRGLPKLAAVMSGAMVVGGVVVGCAPSPTPLSCVATVTTSHPAQQAKEVVTVKTAAHAKVLTVARYRRAAAPKLTVTNALGLGKTAYNVGPAAVGFPVKVVVAVAKGSQKGTCTTGFTPSSAPTSSTTTSNPVSSVSCADVVFGPSATSSDLKYAPVHAYNITASGSANCSDVADLVTRARNTGPAGYWPVGNGTLSCVPTANGATATYLCSGSGVGAAWTIGTFPDAQCSNAPSGISSLYAENTDCATAAGVAGDAANLLADSTANYAGFSCALGPNTHFVLCYTDNKLSMVSFYSDAA